MNFITFIIEFILIYIFAKVASELILRKRASWRFSMGEILTVITLVAVWLGYIIALRRK